MAVHVARLGVFTTNQNGTRIDKNDPATKISDMLNTKMEMLVIPDASIPNSAGYPSIKTYLELEDADNFELRHIDQSFLITYERV